jgi:integrase/recombinase XerD
MHLNDAYDDFMLFKRAQGRAERTLKDYDRCIANHAIPWLRDNDVDALEDLTRRLLWQYADDLRHEDWKTNTRAIYLSNLRTWLNWLHRQDYLERKLGDAVTVPKRQTRQELPPSQNELARLLAACDAGRYPLRDRALILLLASTGARRGEIPGLTLDDLHLADRWVRIYQSKKQRYRFGFLTEQAAEALTAYLNSRDDDDPALFRGKGGGPLGYDGIYQMLRRRAEAAGIDPKRVHTHNFRRLVATTWIENGGDQQRLMGVMDWTSQEMLTYYVRLGSRQALQTAHDQFAPRIDLTAGTSKP